MSAFLDITAAAMAESLDYMRGDVVTYADVTVYAVASERTSDTLSYGGYEQHFAGAVRVLKAGFPEPVKGAKLTVNGTERRIAWWDEDPISWKLHMEDVTR